MDDTSTRLARLEVRMGTVMSQNDRILVKLDDICPQVRENSWWIERIKWAVVLIAVTGVGLGIVSWAMR